MMKTITPNDVKTMIDDMSAGYPTVRDPGLAPTAKIDFVMVMTEDATLDSATRNNLCQTFAETCLQTEKKVAVTIFPDAKNEQLRKDSLREGLSLMRQAISELLEYPHAYLSRANKRIFQKILGHDLDIA